MNRGLPPFIIPLPEALLLNLGLFDSICQRFEMVRSFQVFLKTSNPCLSYIVHAFKQLIRPEDVFKVSAEQNVSCFRDRQTPPCIRIPIFKSGSTAWTYPQPELLFKANIGLTGTWLLIARSEMWWSTWDEIRSSTPDLLEDFSDLTFLHGEQMGDLYFWVLFYVLEITKDQFFQ